MNAMKKRPTLYALLALAALPATAARDPFWPIGYAPPKPEPVAAESEAAPVVAPPQPAKPAVQPVTEAEWAAARKALVITGFTQVVQPDTQQTRILAMVNRRMVAAGDTVTFRHHDVRYLWSVASLTDRTIELVPLKAERVAPLPSDLKQVQ